MKHLLIAALIATTLAGPVRGEVNSLVTVQDFYMNCEVRIPQESNQTADIQFGVCHGFVRGLAEAAKMNCALLGETGFATIIGADLQMVTVAQMMQNIRNWAEDNPSAWSEGSAVLILPLAETWPCGQNQ